MMLYCRQFNDPKEVSTMSSDPTRPAGTRWGVFHRVLQEAAEHHLLRLVIADVPETVEKEALKEALEKAGRTYGEGPYLWGNYRLLPRAEWSEESAPDPAGEAMETVTYADLLDEA